jgi:hypothetical protein
MRKKLRKFSNGGYSTVDPENPVPSIDEDTRSKAMKYVEGASEESRDIGAPVTRAASKSTSKVSQTVVPPTKPAVDMEAERARMENLTKKQALVPVHPEDYIPGAGLLKPMLRKVVEMGAKRTAKEAAEGAAKNVARRAEEGFNPSEALDALKPTRNISVKGKDIPVKQGKPNFGNSTEGKGVKEVTNKSGKKIPVKRSMDDMIDDGGAGAFKRGGAVRSSASRRADGCAIRGKTRA